MKIYEFSKVTQIKLIHELPPLNIRLKFHLSPFSIFRVESRRQTDRYHLHDMYEFVSAAHKEMLINATSLKVHCMGRTTRK